MSPKYRVNVYIDGFNLYHAIDDIGDETLKWVNLKLLSENIMNRYQILNQVKYFSAYATWRPDAYKRHRDFVAANESFGVEAGKASTSYLQRKLRICYSRADRLMNLLEEGGVVSPIDGGNPRTVTYSDKKKD